MELVVFGVVEEWKDVGSSGEGWKVEMEASGWRAREESRGKAGLEYLMCCRMRGGEREEEKEPS